MKIGIVTIYGDNYGNKLQNVALQRIAESLSYKAETIRIINGFNLNKEKSGLAERLNPGRIKRGVAERFKNRYPYKNQRDGIIASIRFQKNTTCVDLLERRAQAFKTFSEKHIKCSSIIIDADDAKWQDVHLGINEVYNCFITGSDQVWNRTKSPYFLRFASAEKRIAFAPSFGVGVIPRELHPIYRKWLSEIPYLSVREERGAEIIRELTGREVPVVPDPTLCLSREEWERIESKPVFADGDYVLTYFLGNETNRYRSYIESYAREKALKIIDLYDMREPEYYAADPAEFVWLIHHAKAMFTDSFHGTVFSLIFHTPFLVFDRIESGGTSMSSRIETLLKMVGMEDRRFRADADVEDIVFSGTDATIKIQADKAVAFLRGALESVSAC